MERRRVELRMSWAAVTRAAGISYEGLRAIRRGERHPNSVTKAKLEAALRWAPGSIDAILGDGEPTSLPADEAEPPAPAVLPSAEDRAPDPVEVLEEMAGWFRTLSPFEQRKALDDMRRERREREGRTGSGG